MPERVAGPSWDEQLVLEPCDHLPLAGRVSCRHIGQHEIADLGPITVVDPVIAAVAAGIVLALVAVHRGELQRAAVASPCGTVVTRSRLLHVLAAPILLPFPMGKIPNYTKLVK